MTRRREKDHERRILESFCAALDSTWKVIEHDREAPDGVITGSGIEVGVELAAYVAQTPDNQRYEADDNLQVAITRRWSEQEDLRFFTPHLFYRKDRGQRPIVPRRDEHEEFVDELAAAVLYYGPHDTRITKLVPWSEATEDKEYPDAPKYRRILSSKWPVLGKYCSKVLISPHPTVPLLLPMTSLMAGWGGVDENQIRNIVSKHLARVTRYRENLGGKPVWLVVHSDGYPLSRYLGPYRIQGALQTAKEALRAHPASFDAAFWLDSPTARSGGTLYPLDDAADALCMGHAY